MYLNKYLKYKNKYLNNKVGGGGDNWIEVTNPNDKRDHYTFYFIKDSNDFMEPLGVFNKKISESHDSSNGGKYEYSYSRKMISPNTILYIMNDDVKEKINNYCKEILDNFDNKTKHIKDFQNKNTTTLTDTIKMWISDISKTFDLLYNYTTQFSNDLKHETLIIKSIDITDELEKLYQNVKDCLKQPITPATINTVQNYIKETRETICAIIEEIKKSY